MGLDLDPAAVRAAKPEAVLGQRLLDLFDRLLAEVRDRRELVLRLRHEIADRLDPDALEAVVRPDPELELLDREVLHPVGERDAGRVAATVRQRGVAVATDVERVEVGEDRQLADQDLGTLGDRVLRIDRAVGRDVEDQLVVVGALPDARRLHVVGDAVDRREHRVDRDDADRVRLPAVALGRHITAPAADRERDLEAALRREVRDLEIGVQDLEVGGSLDVGGGDDTLAALRQPHLHLRRLAVEDADELLQVEDDVRHVLADAGERGELVRDPFDLHGGDGGALEGGEQHAAQRVAERVTEAAIEGFDHENAAVLVHFLVRDLRDLEISRAYSHCCPFYGTRRTSNELLGIQLDDELLGDRRVDLGTLRPLENGPGETVVVRLQPWGDGGGEVGRVPDDLLRTRPGLQRDDVVGLDLVAGDVDAAAVHEEVTVPHELARLRTGRGESEAIDRVVETRLEHAQQVVTGDAALLVRLLVVGAELRLEQAVVPAGLLLLAQLQQVLALLDPAAAVLARRIGAALDGALLGQAALALQEELHALPAALLALRGTITSHYTRLRFFWRTPLCACGETSLTPRISRPAACSERIAVSRPEPGPLTKTSTFCRPCSMPLRAAASAVTCAANGVDLREPLNPAEPADSHTITLPSLSVRATIVLLNDVLMCACPIAMFFRTRRRVRPRVAAALRGGATTSPSSRGRRSSSGPFACARSSSYAGRAPAGCAGAADRGRNRSPAGA